VRSRAELRRWLAALAVWCTASYAVALSRVQLYDPAHVAGYSDVADYVRLYEGKPLEGVRRYRVLTPTLARLVPEAPLRRLTTQEVVTADWLAAVRFSVVNAAFLVLTAAALCALMLALGLSFGTALVGTLLFFTAQPVVQSGSLPMVDAGAWCALAAGAWCIATRRAWALALVCVVGMFAKETTALLVPLVLLAPWPWAERARLLAATAPGVLAYAAVRFWLAPDPAEGGGTLAIVAAHPELSLEWVTSVVTSPARLLDLAASFGLLWLPAVAALRSSATPPILRRWFWIVPLLLLLIAVAFWNLGRVLFHAFPVVVPLAAIGLERWWTKLEGGAATVVA
jgi:hypothetical protein